MQERPSLNSGIRIDRPRARHVLRQRVGRLPSWVVLAQLFIGFGWLRAAAEKIIDGRWWTGAVIEDFADAHNNVTLAWFEPILDTFIVPAAPAVAIVVLAGQLLAGLSLATGRYVGIGIGVGMVLNLAFMATGAVTPSAFYLLIQGAIGLWMAEQKSGPDTIRQLGFAATISVLLAAISVPFIATVHPQHVIEDPAAMFAFGGTLGGFACLLATRPSITAELAPVSPAATYD